MAIFNVRVCTKKDSESNWVSNNPILLDGEEVLSVQSDGSLRRKVGDGTSRYTALGYVGEHAAEADQADYAARCGTASRATQLDSVRRINGVAFNGTKDITVYDPHVMPTVTKRLEAEGWYRIASKTVTGTNDGGLLLLTRSYNTSNAENYVLAFTQGYKRFTLNPISCDVGNQHFTKLRYIYNDDKTPCYIEVYYAFDKANMGAVSVISNTGTYTSEAFTEGGIPDGYSVKEFDIPSAVEPFTASDKAALDGKADAADIFEDNPFVLTDFTHTLASEDGYSAVEDTQVTSPFVNTATIHCKGETLGFTVSSWKGTNTAVKVNGKTVLQTNSDDTGFETISYTLPPTFMTEDLVVELTSASVVFSNMIRRKNNFVPAEQYNALLARVEALENRIGEVSPQKSEIEE